MDYVDVCDDLPLNGWDWIWLGLGVMCDVASYVGGYHKRQQVRGVSS